MSQPKPEFLAALPGSEDGKTFAAPWHAQIFAMTVKLHEEGHFTWPEWTQHLGREIAQNSNETGSNPGTDDYYLCWLTALERLVGEKQLVGDGELVERKFAWDRAARATPHGRPVILGGPTCD